MLIDLKKYFSGENITQQIDYTIDLSAVEIDGVKPFVSPVHVVGDLKAFASSAELNVTVQYAFSMPCNRCLKETRKEISHSISHVLVNRLKPQLADTIAMCGAHSLSEIRRSMLFGF